MRQRCTSAARSHELSRLHARPLCLQPNPLPLRTSRCSGRQRVATRRGGSWSRSMMSCSDAFVRRPATIVAAIDFSVIAGSPRASSRATRGWAQSSRELRGCFEQSALDQQRKAYPPRTPEVYIGSLDRRGRAPGRATHCTRGLDCAQPQARARTGPGGGAVQPAACPTLARAPRWRVVAGAKSVQNSGKTRAKPISLRPAGRDEVIWPTFGRDQVIWSTR